MVPQGSSQLIFIPSTRCCSPHLRWQLKHHLAAEGCEWNAIPPHSHIWRTCTLLSEIEACLHSRPSVLYPTTLPILHICPLDTFSLVNHSLPTIDKTNVNFNSFSGSKDTNNRYSSSGSANQLITSKPSFIKATCWDTGLSTTRPYVPYPTTLPILHICPLDTFSLVDHSPTTCHWQN